MRPLYDDGSADPSAVTRDYTLRVDDERRRAPVLSVFGGKITTYRRLAEQAMEKLAPYFPGMKAGLDRAHAACRAAISRDRERGASELLRSAIRGMPSERPARRSSAATARMRAACSATATSGEDFGAGLTEREVRYFVEHEWARTAEDVLWRRTKAACA